MYILYHDKFLYPHFTTKYLDSSIYLRFLRMGMHKTLKRHSRRAIVVMQIKNVFSHFEISKCLYHERNFLYQLHMVMSVIKFMSSIKKWFHSILSHLFVTMKFKFAAFCRFLKQMLNAIKIHKKWKLSTNSTASIQKDHDILYCSEFLSCSFMLTFFWYFAHRYYYSYYVQK